MQQLEEVRMRGVGIQHEASLLERRHPGPQQHKLGSQTRSPKISSTLSVHTLAVLHWLGENRSIELEQQCMILGQVSLDPHFTGPGCLLVE